MKNVSTHKQPALKDAIAGKQYSYGELIEYLDTHWVNNLKDTSLSCIKNLDKSFGNIAQKLSSIFIAGTNGKSLTAHFTTRLLKEEGLSVGTFYTPHILTYNERLVWNNETIANKQFTDLGNEVLHAAATLGLEPHSLDLLTMMGLLYFSKNNVDVVVWEISDSKKTNPAMICSPFITAITRITDYENSEKGRALLEKSVTDFMSIVPKNSHVISADQSKLHLHIMQQIAEKRGATWSMPIRKLAPLPYPFEQLHGRCAALAERIAYTYINTFLQKDTVIVSNSLLTKQKGQRGRPTLEAKRQAEISPKRTVEQFWKDAPSIISGRFQLLDKEKPTVLLDTASNLDAFENVLLGIRLLHYHRPLKGLTLIMGCTNPDLDLTEFLKLLRYFFKKTSGQIIVCPVNPIPGNHEGESWNAEKITNDIKSMKIKAKAAKNFKEAFDFAQKSVDERHGLVVITGSPAIVSSYWQLKGMKKL